MKLKLIVLVSALGFAGCPEEGAQTAQQAQPAQPATSQPAANVQPTNVQPSQPAQAEPANTAVAQQAPAAAPDEGKKLYMMGCANCHGPDGTGQMMRAMYPKIGDLTSVELHTRMKDADLTALITNGREKMPPFGSVFKPEQIQAIIGYVRTLKKG